MFVFRKRKKIANSTIKQYGINNRIVIVEFGIERPLRNKEVIPGLNIEIFGNDNTIKIGFPFVADNSAIIIHNNNAYVEIMSSPCFSNVTIKCANGDAQVCKIGANTTFYGTTIEMPENSQINIGQDCMFAKHTFIWASDAHSIIDCKTHEILNCIKHPVEIGDHVWIGEGVRISKNTKIHDNSIVAMGAVCCTDYKLENVMIAGVPGKIIRRNVTWQRENPYILQIFIKK